jgi:hypothetical protein
MKITKSQLQKIIKEEIKAIEGGEEEDYSDELLEIEKNLWAAITTAWPAARITVSTLEEQQGRDPEYPEEPPGGEIRVVWEVDAIDADDLRDVWDEEDYDQAAARGGD